MWFLISRQKSLRAFVAVASLGSVARAGTLLGRSDSAVSLQVTSLERDLGHQLFERTGRGLNLTAFGARFLVHAEDILSRIDAARRDAGACEAGGILRVGVVQDLVPCFVQTVIDAIADAPFKPWIEMTTGTSADLAVALGEERLDLAILARRHEEPGMVMSLPMLWLGSPDTEVRDPLPMVAVTPPCPFLDAARRALDAGGYPQRIVLRVSQPGGCAARCRRRGRGSVPDEAGRGSRARSRGRSPPPASPADDRLCHRDVTKRWILCKVRYESAEDGFGHRVWSPCRSDANIGRGRIPMSGTCGDCRPTLMVGAARRVPTTLPCPFVAG